MRGQRDEGRKGRWGLLGVLLGTVVALALSAVPAQADYEEVGTIGSPTSLNAPLGVAIDEETKDLYVASFLAAPSGFEPGSVIKFDASGDPVNALRAGSVPGSVAVNQANGNVYILDADDDGIPGGGFISVVNREGDQLGDTWDAGDSESFPSRLVQMAVDDTGVVYYPDYSVNVLRKYDADGDPAGQITGSDEHTIAGPVAAAVDPAGNVYVVDIVQARVQKFNSAGVWQMTFSSNEAERSVAVADDGRVFVGKGESVNFHITVYDASGVEIDEFGLGDFGTPPLGGSFITVDSTTGYVYASDPGNNVIRVYAEPEPPVATTGQASAVTQTSATLEGDLNPGGAETDCLFLYGEAGGSLDEEAACETDPVEGSTTVDVSADVSGLEPNTEYEFKLTAENSVGSDEGDVESFATLPNAPTATTGSAGGVTQTAATLNATVNANGDDASCVFQYGTSTAYGSTVPCSVNPVTGSSATVLSAALSGLAPGTTYHFRVVAENGGGKASGSNQTFTTAAHTCETDASLCPKPEEPKPAAPAPAPTPAPAPPVTKPKPLKCKKGFKKKKVKGKQKCVKVKKKKRKGKKR